MEQIEKKEIHTNRGSLLTSRQKSYISISFLYFLLGVIVSRSTIFESYSPFGAALVASVPYENIWYALIGAVISYILPNSSVLGIRYIAAVLSIHAIRWTLNDLKKIRDHFLFSPLLASVAIFATGITLNINSFSFLKNASIVIIESVIAGVCAYFLKEASFLIAGKRDSSILTQKRFAGVIMTVCIVMLSLANIKIGHISIGQTLAVVIILFCANNLGVSGGSISGIIAGIIFGFSSADLTYLAGSYAFGGMMSGLLSKFGKFISTSAFIISSLIIVIQSESSAGIITNVCEIILAAIVFVFIPDKLNQKFMSLFCYPGRQEFEKSAMLDHCIKNRLNFAANALINVSESINAVSKKLLKPKELSFSEIYSDLQNNICNHCGLKTLCWEVKKDETIFLLDSVARTLKNNEGLKTKDFPKGFSDRCVRLKEISDFINRFYREQSIRNTSKQRINEVKGFVSDQFSDMGDLLIDISKDFSESTYFDLDLSKKIIALLKRLGIVPIEVICKVCQNGGLSIEIETFNTKKEELEKLNLHKLISKECFRALSEPFITIVQDRCRIKLVERPLLDVQIGVSQHVYNNGDLCGDSYTYFNDGDGNMVLILSDGMGTGGKAAVEGTMACEILSSLIKSGIGFETALKITNSALLVKSEDESLAALDIVSIDLFSGKVKFMKAGAPVTFVKTKGLTAKIDMSTLPVGIFKNVSFFVQECDLSKEDWILILSDGAIFPDDKWIEERLKNNPSDPETLARDIVNQAAQNRTKDYDDDITAIAVKLCINEGLNEFSSDD